MYAIVDALGHPERDVPIDPRRRHQRQGLGHGDGRRGAARRRATARPATPRRTSSISPSGSSSTAGRSSQRARWLPRSPTSATSSTRCCADGALQAQPTFFEVDDRGRVRAVPARRRRRRGARGRARRPARRDQRRARRVASPRSPRSPSTTSSISARRSREIAAEKAGIIKPGVPVVVGPLEPEALHAIDASRGSAARRSSARRRRRRPPRRGGTHRLRTPARDYGERRVGLRGRASGRQRAWSPSAMLELLDAQRHCACRLQAIAPGSPTVRGRDGSNAPAGRRPRGAARRGAQPGRRGGARVLSARPWRRPCCRWCSPRCATRTSRGCCARCSRRSACWW